MENTDKPQEEEKLGEQSEPESCLESSIASLLSRDSEAIEESLAEYPCGQRDSNQTKDGTGQENDSYEEVEQGEAFQTKWSGTLESGRDGPRSAISIRARIASRPFEG